MTTFLTKSLMAVGLGASALTMAVPAEAQYYRGRYHHNDGTGTAIVAGVAGLAIGAAIASNANRDRYYRDDYYYRDRPRYNYYYNDYPQYNYRECRIERRYDYYGRPMRVRVCY